MTVLSRRVLLSAFAPVGCILSSICTGAAFAQAATIEASWADDGSLTPAQAKVFGWAIGFNLALAAAEFYGGKDNSKQLDIATLLLQKAFGIDVPALPQRADQKMVTISVLDYFEKGGGAHIGDLLVQKHELDAAKLYHASWALVVLMLASYASEAPQIAENVHSTLKAMNVPDRLVSPLIDAIDAKKSSDDVTNAGFKMYEDVYHYLYQSAGGK
jgi:hypothetical protein